MTRFVQGGIYQAMDFGLKSQPKRTIHTLYHSMLTPRLGVAAPLENSHTIGSLTSYRRDFVVSSKPQIFQRQCPWSNISWAGTSHQFFSMDVLMNSLQHGDPLNFIYNYEA